MMQTGDPLTAIRKIKADRGSDLVILGHYYQNSSILSVADRVGDSYGLSVAASRTSARYIVFCGVLFMAESARLLCGESQRVFIPDRNAGCPMADMITPESFRRSLEGLTRSRRDPPVPVLYVNSSAEIKALAGEAEGICCTSSNAELIVRSRLTAGRSVYFLPDRNLGMNVAHKAGLGDEDITLTDENGVSSPTARMILWDGYCPIHLHYSIDDIATARKRWPEARILVHPECLPEVVNASDGTGSTGQLLEMIEKAPTGSTLIVGTEINFVRYAQGLRQDMMIHALGPYFCRNMAKITIEKLLLTLESLNSPSPPTEVRVSEKIIEPARLALTRMIRHTEKG